MVSVMTVIWIELCLVGLCVAGFLFFFFFQAEDGIRDVAVTGVQTCALPILQNHTNIGHTPGVLHIV